LRDPRLRLVIRIASRVGGRDQGAASVCTSRRPEQLPRSQVATAVGSAPFACDEA